MGHAVSHFAKNVWGGIKHAADDVAHVAVEGVDTVAHAIKKVADVATTAVVDVGGVMEKVVSVIPGVGGEISGGLAGIVDLTKKADSAVGGIEKVVEHPVDAAKAAAHLLSHPSEALHEVEKVATTLKSVGSDVVRVVKGVAAICPEAAPELMAIANVGGAVQKAAEIGTQISEGHISSALESAIGAIPGTGKFKTFQSVVKAAQKATEVATAMKTGNVLAAIELAKPLMSPAVQKAVSKVTSVVTKAKKGVETITKSKKRSRIVAEGEFEEREERQPTQIILADTYDDIHRHFENMYPGSVIRYHLFHGPEYIGTVTCYPNGMYEMKRYTLMS